MYHNILERTASSVFKQSVRQISLSATRDGRNTMRNIFWDRRGNTWYKEMRKTSDDPLLAYYDYRDRKPGLTKEDKSFELIPEMVPELVVPDLTGFKLKPYISYRAPEVERGPFTSEHLFTAVYQSKIVEDFEHDGLLENGAPKYPSKEEAQTAEEATVLARQTGSDIFAEDPKDPDPPDIKHISK